MRVNRLVGSELADQTADPTEQVEELPCGLVLRSIGYKSNPLPNVPFDSKTGRVVNEAGQVGEGVYAAGWVATGPVGVLLSTMANANAVANIVQQGLPMTKEDKPGTEGMLKILLSQRVKVVMYKHWLKIDQEELERGKRLNKCREKIVDVDEMLEVALG